MKQIFKYLAGHKGAVTLIVLLLVVQAYCDLSLPSYTSSIVDVGIEQGGIEHEAMEEMRNETAHEKAVEIAERMLKSGKLSYEEIAEFAELTIEEVKALNEKGIA